LILLPGRPYPLGPHFDGRGTNFSLFSEVATRVELCLFDEQGRELHHDLPECTGYVWHGYVGDVGPGQQYGYRVHGPWNPAEGKRCNPAKLLLDPYAKAYHGLLRWDDAVFPYPLGGDLEQADPRDSGPFMPRSVVHESNFNWNGDDRLRHSRNETIIYELHVKGFTQRHPGIPEALRGTYAGLAHPASVQHLKSLGVTAVELQPVHQFVHDRHLVDRGLRNYWGYNSIGFFAPHQDYAADKRPGAAVDEFKAMVRTLHTAGIEVILDVVYNHTAEGNHLGPMLSFRGIDNAAYYRLAEDRRYNQDFSGTGNSLNMRHPHVLKMIMDSLRYWITEMHVDGFRFDLAAALARELNDVDRLSVFFDVIQQDPLISEAKLIAEPWDVGPGGYQVGKFPPNWSEWNGRYRDCVRDFWRGQDQTLAEFASRFAGSSDLYQNTGRLPVASVNFVTAHDGFTLEDLVSYNDKHNEANGEDNRDGDSNNRSWNCGVEGPTQDPAVLALRHRQKRNLLATLLLSQGLPMLVAGDELGRSQGGNNNAYCQDNEVSWLDWERQDKELQGFVQGLVAFLKAHPVFRRRHWFQGQAIHGTRDIAWFKADGQQFEEEHWGQGFAKTLAVFLNGDSIPNPNPMTLSVKDDSFYVAFNAHHEPVEFTLPESGWGKAWAKVLDTAGDPAFVEDAAQPRNGAGDKLTVAPRSLQVHKREA
jgi:isoamylase